MKNLSSLLLLLFSLCLVQCQRELSYTVVPDIIPETPVSKPITANVQGNILDENKQPAAGVTVKVGSKSALTNAKGYFRINDAALDEKTALVTAEKTGYFKGLRSFSATAGTNHIVIQMLKKDMAGTVSATAGGSASLSNGMVVELPANGIVQQSTNAAYSGAVNVYATYIDPTSADITQTVPGSLTATDKDGKRTILTSYGMVAVELESPSGEKLQLKEGSAATLTMPIPAAGLASAPATIPLWFVNEQTGLWQEEGTATKQGNLYVGQVKHFSFWNCDISSNAVTLSLKVVDTKNFPLVHVQVRVTRTSGLEGFSFSTGFTDSLGNVSGFVPSGEPLRVDVLDPCGNVVHSRLVQPLVQSTNLGAVLMPATASVLRFSGTLLNCSGTPVTNGFAIIIFNNVSRYAKTDAAGKFVTTFAVCPNSPTTSQVIGIDETTGQQSLAVNVAIVEPETVAGDIVTCGTSSVQFINYNLEGTNYSISSASGDSIVANLMNQGNGNYLLSINGAHITNNLISKISFAVANPTAVGSFPLSSLSVQSFGNAMPAQPINVVFTGFANSIGEFYEGSFTGQFRDSGTTTLRSISTSFRVRKTN